MSEALDNPTALLRGLPSKGPEWDAAIEMGVDVLLIERNLELPPRERFHQAMEHLRFSQALRRRTVPRALLAQLERERLWQKIEALGGPDPAWPEELRDGR